MSSTINAISVQVEAEGWANHATSINGHIKELPFCRGLLVRDSNTTIDLKKKSNVTAILGQTRGDVAANECLECSLGLGKFAECVVVRGQLSGACCNCFYMDKSTRCSLRRSARNAVVSNSALPPPSFPSTSIGRPVVGNPDHNSSQNLSLPQANGREHLTASSLAAKPTKSESIEDGLQSLSVPSRKRQRNSETTSFRQDNGSRSNSGVSSSVNPLENEIHKLRATINRNELANRETHSKKDKLIRDLMMSIGASKTANQHRSRELENGLQNISGTPLQIQSQIEELIEYSRATKILNWRLAENIVKVAQDSTVIEDEEELDMFLRGSHVLKTTEQVVQQKLSFTKHD